MISANIQSTNIHINSNQTKVMKNRKLQTLLFLGLLASGTLRAQVQVPDIINYQGRISKDNVNHPGPTLQFKFALVNPNGATTFWSNDESSVNGSEPSAFVTLGVADGLFHAPLGDTSLPGMTRGVPSTAFDNRDVHLRIWVRDPNGTPAFELLAPDVRLGSVGYAMLSANVINGAIGPNKLANGAITQDKIAGNTISGDKLKDGAITSDKLANSSVDTRHLIDGSVKSEKLSDQAVTAEKLDPALGVWSKSGTDITYTGGAVGIGTTTPQADLHIRGASELGSVVIAPGAGGRNSQLMLAEDAAGREGIVLRYEGVKQHDKSLGVHSRSVFGTETELVTIKRGGNVGIGVTQPQARLHVVSPTAGDGSVILPNEAVGAAEIADEPGLASNVESRRLLVPAGAVRNIVERLITCPANGYVIATATTEVYTEDWLGSPTWLQITTQSETMGLPARKVNLEGNKTQTITLHEVFQVSAGPHTFYLIGAGGADNHFNLTRLTLLFIPTAYGVTDARLQ